MLYHYLTTGSYFEDVEKNQTILKLKHVYILDTECLWAVMYTTDMESKHFLDT